MKKIILIDDDPVSNYLSEMTINSVSENCLIKSFTNPVEFLSSINTLNIDNDTIVLLDLNMPEMSGWEVLNRFEKTGSPGNFFILTSSSINVEMQNENRSASVKNFLTKPLTKTDVKFFLEEE